MKDSVDDHDSPPVMQQNRRKLSLKKKLFFSSIILGLLVVGLEFLSRYFIANESGYRSGIEDLWQEQDAIAASGRGTETARENLHPYVGWTFNPDVDPGVSVETGVVPVNRFGLIDFEDPIQRREPDRVIIGIAGGSFAQEFNNYASETLKKLLRDHEEFRDKEIVIVRLAMAGYKQPQQAQLLNYLFTLGAEFDYVVNLDGFNEGVLPVTNNYSAHVHFSYPYGWEKRLLDVVDPRMTGVSFELFTLRARRQTLAQGVVRSRFRNSALRNMVWSIRNEAIQRKLGRLGMDAFRFRLNEGKGFASSGPDNTADEEGQYQQDVLNLWKRASLQMHYLCAGHGTIYLHLLQPNQYLNDSKPFTEWEEDHARADDHEFAKQVRTIYPRMRNSASWFAEKDVNFYDLTQVFSQTQETIYRDWCCHINQAGNLLVAQEVTNIIASH